MNFVTNYPQENKSFNDLQCEKIAKFYNGLSKISDNLNYPIFFNYSQSIIKYEELPHIYFYFMLIVNENYENHINNVCKIIDNPITRNTICLLLNSITNEIKQLNQYDFNIKIDPHPELPPKS